MTRQPLHPPAYAPAGHVPAGHVPAADSAPKAARVLVVEDEPSIADVLAITLRFHGFEVVTASGAQAAVTAAREERPDAVLLDIALPDGDGRQVCRVLRAERGDLAVVFLTAKDAPAEVVQGLTLGGDDYITKPFNVDEVVARLRAVLRRTARGSAADAGGAPPAPRPPVLRYGDLELDEATYTVRRGGRDADLTPTEFALLRHLVRHGDRIVPKEQLLKQVWRYEHPVESTVVETYISYLRRKLARLGPPLIRTRRGVGYGLRPPEPQSPPEPQREREPHPEPGPGPAPEGPA
ncbi:response regulator transcription factor [Streptomyces sp. NBC_01795]|uniref:response regulator transcription factor n=1 Tax=unclassified Streptomyces TaxID=2593676 RepID=UPI002DDB2544|nr:MULTISPECIES: response regulator transcription factor [unclassified Streptomyces]WSA92822.1 response regulator transcription factor [Streptomyces sp. NBC_01795]WSB77192.1 response regulator transcription factor [Streptomyces sp. NBC_01775]